MNRDRDSLYMKIFRPWAHVNADEQDSTISTTVDPDDESVNLTSKTIIIKETTQDEVKQTSTNHIKVETEKSTKHEINKPKESKVKCAKVPRTNQNNNASSECLSREIPAALTQPTTDWFDASSASMFTALGLTNTDALLLEAASLTHGHHAAEEYARILLGEERRARLHAAARKQRPKKYKCPHCDVGFSNNGQLKGHIRIHTGERPFRCDVTSCGKTFTRNEELTRHKRIHSGLRPFPCTECGKRFGRKDHLKKHTRTHAQHRAAAAVAAVYAMPVMSMPSMFLPPPGPSSCPPTGPVLGFDPWGPQINNQGGFLHPVGIPSGSAPGHVLYGF